MNEATLDATIPTRSLLEDVPQRGRLDGIQLRTALHGPIATVDQVDAVAGLGLIGDRRAAGRTPTPTARRQVTLIQAEHLDVIASLLGLEAVDPAATRRNLVVSGINLGSLRTSHFTIGGVTFEGTGHCHPCSIMESTIGPGAFQAMRGHGGITARILQGGTLRVGDSVRAVGASVPDQD